MDTDISHLIFNLKQHGICQFALQLIPLTTTSNLSSLEVVQECQSCQFCVLLGNSCSKSREAKI